MWLSVLKEEVGGLDVLSGAMVSRKWLKLKAFPFRLKYEERRFTLV